MASLTAGCLNRPVGEQTPRVSNIFVDQIAQNAVDKIDLLFMIDNSLSMQDKQSTLREAVPKLVERLVTPVCVDSAGNATLQNADENGDCPEGLAPEFKPIRDIHIGVITSSLGGHGGDQCSPLMSKYNASMEDNAHLLSGRGAVSVDTGGLGFLNWAPEKDGERDSERFKQNFQSIIELTGENGCGYEASLEAWYRFLIEPDPPKAITVKDNHTLREGIDDVILSQRANFLRPDSLVAIIMLSDENDCSVRDDDTSIGFVVARSPHDDVDPRLRVPGAPKATAACEQDPNSTCCRSCAITGEPAKGCPSLEEDPGCAGTDGYYPPATPDPAANLDNPNLRCFKQKQRFGVDLLWGTDRYVKGLTESTITNSAGQRVPNPLFQAPPGQRTRSKNLVFLAGIIGVPWQDVATTDSLPDGARLKYLSYGELTELERWDDMLGDPANNVSPRDPLMIESVEPRTGSNPILAKAGMPGAALGPVTSQNPHENAGNGHEADYSSLRRDLQYACIYKLPEPKPCTLNEGSCDCKPDNPDNPGDDSDLRFNRPLCNPPTTGPAEPKQYFAKGYPGLRQLQVLKDFGAITKNSILASICPKFPVQDRAPEAASYGYNPAVDALVDRLKEQLGGKCLTRKLNIVSGVIPCKVVETTRTPGQTCGANGEPPAGCSKANGRAVVDAKLGKAVREQLRDVAKSCGGADTPCEEFCMCEIKALPNDPDVPDEAADNCETLASDADVAALTTPGYCYVDPYPPPIGQNIGSVAALEGGKCPETEPRRLRFAGPNTPANGSITFIACLGEGE